MALAHSSTAVEPVWTPRQREVLALLVRGRTNGQIAEELGISLDGAKWHVSEIITKLGVDSREDAAEYWRARNGLRPRFTRLVKSLIPGPIWAKAAGVSAVIAAAGIAAAAITIWVEQGDDSRSAPDVPPTAVASAATGDAGAASTSTTPGPEVIDGVTVRPLTLGAEMQLPRGLVVYYNVVGYATDGGITDPIRVYRDASGALVRDHIFATLPKLGAVFTVAVDYGNQQMAVGLCTKGYCGGLASADPDSTAVLYRSNDGGVTWIDSGPLPVGSFLAAVTQQGIIASNPSGSGDTYSNRFAILPAGTPLVAPSARAYPFAVGGGDWVWFDSETGQLTSSDGTRALWRRPGGGNAAPSVSGQMFGTISTAWSGYSTPANYIGIVNASGKFDSVFSSPGNADVRAVSRTSEGTLIGNVGVDQSGNLETSGMPSHFQVALFDLATAQIHPIPDVSAGLAGFNNNENEHAFVSGAMTGNFVRVNTGGDCLNVRETATTSAKSLGCFKDGVLLRLADPAPTDGWYRVTTPAGAPGWASAQFLAP